MIWSPGAVYGFVRAAGFPVDTWANATALALAVSGGDDLYRDVSHPGPSVDRRGLFGIDPNTYPQIANMDLFSPSSNARAAYALWIGADRTFGWSAVTVPQPASLLWQEAVQAVKAGPLRMAVAGALHPHALNVAHNRVLGDIVAVNDYVRSHLRNGA